jgi:hypothetical protein
VYCPSCGSNNQDDKKFCTRCGTNLGVVSDALAGKPTSEIETDERMVKLLKDYYRSRPMTLIGAAGSALSLFKLAGVFLLGFPEKMMPIAGLAIAFFFLSLYAFIWGLIRWNNSSSELKALGTSPSKLQKSIATSGRLSTTERAIEATVYSTDPIKIPGSVTEQTTRQLDERHNEDQQRLFEDQIEHIEKLD